MTPPLPGLSVRLYQLFAEASGRWSTPQWMYGTDVGKPRAYKLLIPEPKPLKMIPHAISDGGSHDE